MRNSLLTPIPELELAAKLLDAAADAMLLGEIELAEHLVARADIPAISVYSNRLVGKMSLEVHKSTKRPQCIPKPDRDAMRMPTVKEQAAIFERDGWRCRFCAMKVINRLARKTLAEFFSIKTNWASVPHQAHSSLYAMAASLDHVFPHGRGGKNEFSNFVTACYCCQFGRGEWTLQEVELDDPRNRPPVVDSWDGLSRIVGMKPGKLLDEQDVTDIS